MNRKTTGDSGVRDLTKGSLMKNIIKYSLPIIFTGLLQLLFNACDYITVGNFASETALAAVGSTGPLTSLIVNLALGISVGAGVCASQLFGAGDRKKLSDSVHTSMLLSIFLGVVCASIAFFGARTFLIWTGTPENVIDQSETYVKIYALGIPFMIIYNFGSSILRALGDTKRPLYYLIASGIINVIVNLISVIVFHLDVAGVAMATSLSQLVCCVLVVKDMVKTNGPHKLFVKKLKINKDCCKDILRIGIPSGIQSSFFSISNVLIQSSINSLGDVVMGANSAAGNIEGFVYIVLYSFNQTATSFVGQHIGAGKPEKIKKILGACLLAVTVIGIPLGGLVTLFREPLLGLYANGRADVIAIGAERILILAISYVLCGYMDSLSGTLRGMGYSSQTMIIVLLSVCGLRIAWVYTVFASLHTYESLLWSYPISWIVCSIVLLVLFFFANKKVTNVILGKQEEKAENPIDN